MVAPVALIFGKDANNQNAYAPVPSNNIFSATLVDGRFKFHGSIY